MASQDADDDYKLRLSPSGKELTECPQCKVAVRVDRLEKHLRTVHRIFRPTSRHVVKPDPKVRECPHCHTAIEGDKWSAHIKVCPARPKKVQAKTKYPSYKVIADKGRLPTGGLIVDEYGIVHSYKVWKEDQTLGDYSHSAGVTRGRVPSQKKGRKNISRSTSEAKEKAQAQPTIKFSTCQYCGCKVWSLALDDHIKDNHPEKLKGSQSKSHQQVEDKSNYLACPICKYLIPPQEYQQHVQGHSSRNRGPSKKKNQTKTTNPNK